TARRVRPVTRPAANERARRQRKANRRRRDTQGWLARRLGGGTPAAGRDPSAAYACRRSAGAAADAGSIPAASIRRFRGYLRVDRSSVVQSGDACPSRAKYAASSAALSSSSSISSV